MQTFELNYVSGVNDYYCFPVINETEIGAKYSPKL